jgi:hypothetical protein
MLNTKLQNQEYSEKVQTLMDNYQYISMSQTDSKLLRLVMGLNFKNSKRYKFDDEAGENVKTKVAHVDDLRDKAIVTKYKIDQPSFDSESINIHKDEQLKSYDMHIRPFPSNQPTRGNIYKIDEKFAHDLSVKYRSEVHKEN